MKKWMDNLFRKNRLAATDGNGLAQTGLLKLNLGCGNDYRAGYLNVDFNDSHRVDLVSDVVHLQEIKDASCTEVVAQDVLEHVPRCRCLTALKEWNRVLQTHGTLKIRVPSIIDLVDLLKKPGNQDAKKQMDLVQCLFGTQGYEGDFHYNGFTEPSLKFYMHEAGFAIRQTTIRDGWLFDVVAEKTRDTRPDALLEIESNEDFLRAAYVELLHREADSAGGEHYRKVLTAGISREAVLESLKNSDEYKKKWGSESH